MKRTTKFNKIMALILCMLMVVSTFTIVPMTASAVTVEAPATADTWDGSTVTKPAKGDGSKANPYQIATCENFIWMRDAAALKTEKIYEDDGKTLKEEKVIQEGFRTNMVYFVLVADLNFDGNKAITGVAAGKDADWATISLDGRGHTIYNLDTAWGLFDRIGRDTTTGEPAVLKNFNLVGFTSTRGGIVAAIAQNTDGAIIENVTIDATSKLDSTADHAAAFVGRVRSNTLTIRNCRNEADVASKTGSAAGFIVTQNGNNATAITLENCVNKGNVTAATHAGGFYACKESSKATLTFRGCANYGTITTTCEIDTAGNGGILGYHWNNPGALTIENCYNYGAINSTKVYTGGIVGYLRTTPNQVLISGCANYGDVTVGDRAVGGIVGYINYSKGTASTTSMTIQNCTNAGSVFGNLYIGGIVGWIAEFYSVPVTISGCVNTADVPNATVGALGGIVGYFDRSAGTVTNCVNDGDMITSGNHCGGIIGLVNKLGLNNETSKQLNVTSCMNNGDVSAFHGAGGMVGSIENASDTIGWLITIDKVANTGEITAERHAGGIVGKFQANASGTPATSESAKHFITFSNAANIGNVTATGDSGYAAGVVGMFNTLNLGTPTTYWRILLQNCYNTGNNSNTGSGGMAAGLVARQHVYANAASASMVGLDFVSCFAAGSMFNNNQYCGPFLGDCTDAESTLTITDSWEAATHNNGRAWNSKISGTGDVATNSGEVASITTEIAGLNNTTIALEIEKINKTIMGFTADPTLSIATNAKNLSIRLKMTAPFGFMAITTVKNGNTSANYHNGLYTLKFAFLTSATAITTADQIFKNSNTVTMETATYNGSATMQFVEFGGLNAATIKDTVYFVCYLEDVFGNRVSTSEVRSLTPYDLVNDIAVDGKLGAQVVENAAEVALYQKIVAYCAAYEKFDANN